MDFAYIPPEIIANEIFSFVDLEQLYDNRYQNQQTLQNYLSKVNESFKEDPQALFELAINKDDPEIAANLIERYPKITHRLFWLSARYGAYAVVLYLLEFLNIDHDVLCLSLGRLIELTKRTYPEYTEVVEDAIAELYQDRILETISYLISIYLFGKYDLVDSLHGRSILNLIKLLGRIGRLNPDVLDNIGFKKFPKNIQRSIYYSLAQNKQITPELVDYLFVE